MPKNPKRPIVALTPDLDREARSLYVVGNEIVARIAEILTERHGEKIATASINAAAKRGRWERARLLLCEDSDVLASRAAQSKHLADSQATVKVIGEEIAVLLMETHRTLLRKQAEQASKAQTDKQVADAARVVGPVAPNMAAARLLVDLSTEKTDDEDDKADDFCRRFVVAIAEQLDAAPPDGAPGHPAPVEPPDGAGAAPVAGATRG
jgi:hypothetical protein